MQQFAASNNLFKRIQFESQHESQNGFVNGYDSALLDIRQALCFDGEEHADLAIVLTLLEEQNMKRRQNALESRA